MNVFGKLQDARNRNQGVTLEAWDVDLLFELVGDEIGAAEGTLEYYQELIADQERAIQRHTQGK